MSNAQIIDTCRRRGWIVVRDRRWKIVPNSMNYPQGVSAKRLTTAYRLCVEWFGDES